MTECDIIKLYENNMSISEISRISGHSRQYIIKLLKKFGVYKKGYNPQRITINLSLEDAKKYIEEGYTVTKLSKLLGIPKARLSSLLKSYGFDIKKNMHMKSVPPKEDLEHLYWETGKCFLDIAKHYNTSNVTVRKWFRDYGIVVRNLSDTIRGCTDKIKASKQLLYGSTRDFSSKEFQKMCLKNRNKNNSRISKEEAEFVSFVNSFGNIFVKDVDILGGRELDAYNKELNIAFEYCGLYWHTETSQRDKNYHYTKYKGCLDKNIRLITVFSDEWITRKPQVKNFIESILNKKIKRIFARKCEVSVISRHVASLFIYENHIQPLDARRIKYAYGLYDDGVLIGVMTFGEHHRTSERDSIILNRLAFKSGVIVVGGSSKLFKYFLKGDGSKYSKIISWSDNRWSFGNVYEKMGFVNSGDVPIDYSYYKNKVRTPKQSMTRTKLNCTSDDTEASKALELGYKRVWDCGKIRWVYNKNP